MPKKIITLSLITFVLALLVFYIPKPTSFQSSTQPFLPHIKPDAIKTIDMEYFIEGIHLEKDSSGTWMVQNKKTTLREAAEKNGSDNSAKNEKLDFETKYPADPEKVSQLLEKFLSLEKSDVISNNVEKQNMFQLTNVGRNISFYGQDGKMLVKILVGKPGPDMLSAFIRSENDNNVYLVPEPLQQLVTPDLDSWKKTEEKKETAAQPVNKVLDGK